MSDPNAAPSPPLPRVRLAAEADVPAVVGIYVRAYAQPPWNEQNDPGASERYLRWVTGHPGTVCLLSLDAAGAGEPGAPDEPGRVAGFALTGPRPYAHFVEDWERMAQRPPEGWPVVPGRLGYLWEIAVDPSVQRRGHGSALMAAAIDALRRQGVETLLLRSSERAAPAMALYRRFGFQRLPVRETRDPLAGPWMLRL
jgi:ribosomal protein S18 acetylase RimI-like enzyme